MISDTENMAKVKEARDGNGTYVRYVAQNYNDTDMYLLHVQAGRVRALRRYLRGALDRNGERGKYSCSLGVLAGRTPSITICFLIMGMVYFSRFPKYAT